MSDSSAPARLVAGLLAFTGGWVDVICLIRYETFVATMTGNLVITGQTLYEVFDAGVLPSRHVAGHEHLKPHAAIYLVTFRAIVMICNCLGALTYSALQRRFPLSTASYAAPVLAGLSLLTDIIPQVVGDDNGLWSCSQWSVCCLAFSLGATHYLCSPTNDGSRLRAVTMAATGHMHKLMKQLYRQCAMDELKPSEREGMAVAIIVVVAMAFGALLGAAALHLNPFGRDADDWLLVPVAIMQLVALIVHDATIPPPGGWPSPPAQSYLTPGVPTLHTLREPLTGSRNVQVGAEA